jgi:hypothetical protein
MICPRMRLSWPCVALHGPCKESLCILPSRTSCGWKPLCMAPPSHQTLCHPPPRSVPTRAWPPCCRLPAPHPPLLPAGLPPEHLCEDLGLPGHLPALPTGDAGAAGVARWAGVVAAARRAVLCASQQQHANMAACVWWWLAVLTAVLPCQCRCAPPCSPACLQPRRSRSGSSSSSSSRISLRRQRRQQWPGQRPGGSRCPGCAKPSRPWESCGRR